MVLAPAARRRGVRRAASAARSGLARRRDGASTPSGRCWCTDATIRSASRFRPTRSASCPTSPSRRRRATSTCRGTRSTRGSRRDASSSTTRRTRITGSTAARRTGHCGWSSQGTTLVDTSDTMIVFETALAPRALRRSVACAHRPVAALGHHQLLQLQGLRHVLVGRDRRGRRRGRRVELSTTRCPKPWPIKGYFSFDAGSRRRCRRAYRLCDARHTLRRDHGAYGCVTVGYGCVCFPWSGTLPAVCQREGESLGPLHRQRS